MQDQPVMCVLEELFRHHFHKLFFDIERSLAGGEAGTVSDPKNVGVDPLLSHLANKKEA